MVVLLRRITLMLALCMFCMLRGWESFVGWIVFAVIGIAFWRCPNE